MPNDDEEDSKRNVIAKMWYISVISKLILRHLVEIMTFSFIGNERRLEKPL